MKKWIDRLLLLVCFTVFTLLVIGDLAMAWWTK